MATTTMHVDFTNPRLEWHMRFTCPECGEEHNSQQDWRRHLNDKHNYLRKTVQDFDFVEINERYHECQICHKWVANAHQAIALLQYHRFLHLPFSRTYSCRHCAAAFSRKRALCEHLYRFHGRIISRMEKLRRAETAAENASLRNPKENPEFYLRFLCPQCGKLIDRFQQWLHHLDSAHYATSTDLRMHRIPGTNNHYCKQCKKLFYTSNKAKLQRHRFEHLPYRMYFQCAFCAVKKAYKSDLLRHFIRCHPRSYANARPHVRKPVEWAATISERLDKELDMLLKEEPDPVEASATDLIQRALINSRIDLEYESAADDLVSTGPAASAPNAASNPNEYALNQSLNDLEAILRADLKETNNNTNNNNHSRSSLITPQQANEEQELEELCAAMFETLEKTDNARNQLKRTRTLDGKVEPQQQHASAHEEQIVSLEINSVTHDKSTQATPPLSSPKRKRTKRHEISASALSAGTRASDAKSDDLYTKALESFIIYLCPECGVEFTQHARWRTHVINAHDIDNLIDRNFRLLDDGVSYLCMDCMEVQNTTRHSELQRHRFRHMPYQYYLKCCRCGESKSNKYKMLDHINRSHPELCAAVRTKLFNLQSRDQRARCKFRCNNCGKQYQTEGRWVNHRRVCMQLPGANITVRNYNIHDNLRLIAHLREAHARIQSLMHLMPTII